MAALARLALTAEEERRLAGDLDAILRYVAQLDELDTAGVEATSHPLDPGSALRDDQVRNPADPEAVLGNAPERAGDFFRVPKIIE